jgi:hypothetical protein
MTCMDWHRLAQAIVDRRTTMGLRTREALLAAVEDTPHKLSRRVLADLETGRRDNYDQATLARLEHALEWPRGEVLRILRDREAPTEVVDLSAELMTFDGLVANLHRIDAGVLADLLHRSGLGPEQRWLLVQDARAQAVAQLRAGWQRLAEQIVERGGTVDSGAWPSWLEAPPMVEEMRRGEG